MCTTGIIQTSQAFFMYTDTITMYNYTWHISPCFSLCLPFAPLCSPFSPLLLTWNPPSCDRICPPRSQIACKLTSPDPTLSPNPPPSKFPEPQLPSASLRIVLFPRRTLLYLLAFALGNTVYCKYILR
jgi:hypothetical protein